jgi:predicted lipoprotein with Yx(FWY)xxD motif
MTQSRRFLTGTAVAAVSLLALAACGGNGADSGSDTSAVPESPAAGGGLVTTRQVDKLGTILVDGDGQTLYTTEAEAGGKLKCVDSCTDFWPPLTTNQKSVPASIPGVAGKFGVVTRPDKTRQVTLNGLPLYNFAEDRAPGSARGEGFEDDFQGTHFLWHAATTTGTPAEGSTSKSPAPTEDSGDDDGGYDYGY